MNFYSFPTPLGDLTLFEEKEKLVSIDWGRAPGGNLTPFLSEAERQIEAYFDGNLKIFTLPYLLSASPFATKVLSLVSQIPYGCAWSYGDLAREIGTSPRAIGKACRANHLPLLIPCHRVIGAHGKIGGYSGVNGILGKKFLLELEQG